ncbi:hypothetical protein N7471_009202 [Penicillium samsonianum]|uniref:uncharacterized protein n=1 Tax=Penicillium samsonianum TaxID=1882272 RepID=UPI002546E79B|nr:uncharacterized protein N7471_009202 [Penicillium samsonianum]KAJ6127985.1 hypothetical protein N7471_009202 [Penicillium samsonianum]
MNLITKHSTLLGHLEYFAGVPGWVIEASCLEAAFLVHEVAESTRLKRRKDLDKAFILRLTAIPIAVNYATKACLGKHVVLGMVDICEFNYHVDPLIEGIKDRSPDTMQLIEKVICQIFSDKDSSGVLQNKSEGDAITLEACQGHEEVYQLVKELEYSAKQFIEHPHVLTAGDYEQRNLRMEIRVGLLAQVSKVAMAIPDSSSAPDLSFYQFIQKIGADDTLSSMAIKSIICFIQGPSDVVCATPIERYLLEEFNRHVAIWTRMWNDHSSIERDRVDSSLNVVDFPEFQSCIEDAGKRRSLADLIQHEEDRLNESLERFASAVASRPKAGYVVTGLRWYLGILHVFREQYNAGAVYASKMM